MFTGWYCHVASLFTTECHKDNVTFLAANEAKDCAGHIAEVLLGEPHVTASAATRGSYVWTKKTQTSGHLGSSRPANTNCLSWGWKRTTVASQPWFTLNKSLTQNTWTSSFLIHCWFNISSSFIKLQLGHTVMPLSQMSDMWLQCSSTTRISFCPFNHHLRFHTETDCLQLKIFIDIYYKPTN